MEESGLLTGTDMSTGDEYEQLIEWLNNSYDNGSKGHACALELLAKYEAIGKENRLLRERVMRLEQHIYETSN